MAINRELLQRASIQQLREALSLDLPAEDRAAVLGELDSRALKAPEIRPIERIEPRSQTELAAATVAAAKRQRAARDTRQERPA